MLSPPRKLYHFSLLLLLVLRLATPRVPLGSVLSLLFSDDSSSRCRPRFITLRPVHCARLLPSPHHSTSAFPPATAFFYPLSHHVVPSLALSLSLYFCPSAIRLSFTFFRYPPSLLRLTNWLLSISASLVRVYSTA